MKQGIHPNYVLAKVSCACGAEFVTRSTKPEIKLDICSSCHPLFTGKQKLLDREGRVEKFNKRFASTEGKMVERKTKAAKTTKTTAPKTKVLSTSPRKAAAATAAKAKKAEKTDKKPAAAPKAEKKS